MASVLVSEVPPLPPSPSCPPGTSVGKHRDQPRRPENMLTKRALATDDSFSGRHFTNAISWQYCTRRRVLLRDGQ